jgi:hypothetical protein
MKTISTQWFLFWICLLVTAAIVVGRYIERTSALQNDIANLQNRVHQLEIHNVHREERHRLLSRAVAWIPFVKHFFHHR